MLIGKEDGPCGLFVFREGVAGAIDQRVDADCRLAKAQLAARRLPAEFSIHAYDCGCPCPTELRCTASAGVWQRSEMSTGSETDRLVLFGAERREQWQARIRWLDGKKG